MWVTSLTNYENQIATVKSLRSAVLGSVPFVMYVKYVTCTKQLTLIITKSTTEVVFFLSLSLSLGLQISCILTLSRISVVKKSTRD
jgi:hypothetical protein